MARTKQREGPSNLALVREALATLGMNAKPAEIHKQILKHHNLDIPTMMISSYKAMLQKSNDNRKKRPRKMVRTPISSNQQAVTIRDIVEVKTLIHRHGGKKLSNLIVALSGGSSIQEENPRSDTPPRQKPPREKIEDSKRHKPVRAKRPPTGFKTINSQLQTRIESLKHLQPGWLDGRGTPPSHSGLDQIASGFTAYYPDELPVPYLFPTIEGGLLVEWSVKHWSPSLEVDLATNRGNWHSLNLDTDEETTRKIDLSLESDWRWLSNQIHAMNLEGK